MQQPYVFRALNAFQPMLDTRLQTVAGPSKLTVGGGAWQEIQLPGYCCIVMDRNGFKIRPEFQLHLLCPVKICSGANALWWFKTFSPLSHPLIHTCHLTLPAHPLAFYLSHTQVTPSPQHWLLGSVPHVPHVPISYQPALGTSSPKTGGSCKRHF